MFYCNRIVHVWWECDRIHPFWKQVSPVFEKIYDDPLQLTPEIALLSILPGSITSQTCSLLRFFLSAARQLIPLFWKTTTIPTLALWTSTMNDIMRMEEMLALDNDTYEKFTILWSVWRRFSSTDTLVTLLPVTPTPTSSTNLNAP